MGSPSHLAFVRPSGAVLGAMEVWISAVVGGLVALGARGWWVALMWLPAVRRRVARACLRVAWLVAGPSLLVAMAEARASVELRWGTWGVSGPDDVDLGPNFARTIPGPRPSQVH